MIPDSGLLFGPPCIYIFYSTRLCTGIVSHSNSA